VWLSGDSIVNTWILFYVHIPSTTLFEGSPVKYTSIFMSKFVKLWPRFYHVQNILQLVAKYVFLSDTAFPDAVCTTMSKMT